MKPRTYQPYYTKPVRPGAVRFEKDGKPLLKDGEAAVRYRGRGGRMRTARLTVADNGEERMLLQTKKYRGVFTDARGKERDVPLGVTDGVEAAKKLNKIIEEDARAAAGLSDPFTA